MKLLHRADTNFLYLRTRYDVSISVESIEVLADAVDSAHVRHTRLLEHRNNAVAWNNGFVLALSSPEPATELARRLRPGLDAFGSWGLLANDGGCIEVHGEGPMGLFIEQARNAGFRKRPAQVFLMFHEPERDAEGIAEAVRSQLGSGRSRAVFHFEDGRVILCASEEPARLLARRAEAALRRLYTWSILDSGGDALFRDESGAWRSVDLFDLEFTG